MKTIKQEDFHEIDVFTPEDNNNGDHIEIWQGKAGDRQSINIESDKIPELIQALSFHDKTINKLVEDKYYHTNYSTNKAKKLSEISDEDAIQVAKILKPNDEHTHNSDYGKMYVKQLMDGVMYSVTTCFRLYQYLQSKGYELPVYFSEPKIVGQNELEVLQEIKDLIVDKGCCGNAAKIGTLVDFTLSKHKELSQKK